MVGLRHGGCGFESWWVKGMMVVGLGYGGSMVGGAWWVRHSSLRHCGCGLGHGGSMMGGAW